jgi:predicted ATPase
MLSASLRTCHSRFIHRAADSSKEHFFVADAVLAERSASSSSRPHVVVLDGAAGVGKSDALARLAKQGYATVEPISVVAALAAQFTPPKDRQRTVDAVLHARDAAWHDAVESGLARVAASRSNVLFVTRHPATARFAHAEFNSPATDVDALLHALALDRSRWSMSMVLFHTDAEIRRQRLEARAFGAASEAERLVRTTWLREADPLWRNAIAERFDDQLVGAGAYDGAVDSTSVKQAVARLLSMLAIGKSSFESPTAKATAVA